MILPRALSCLIVAVALAGFSPAPAPAAAPHAPVEEDAGARAETSLNPLTWSRDLALWTGVVFVLLLVVLAKYAWGPIADGLEKRERRIAEEIAEAEKIHAEARRLLEEYQRRLAASEDQVRQMIEAARRDAEKVGQGIVEKARIDAQAEHRRALEEIDRAVAGAIEELAERSAALAVELAGKIVSTRLDPSAHARLIEQAVASFTAGNSGRH